MSLDYQQVENLIVRPTLDAIGAPQNSEAAVQLIMATGLVETQLRYLRQIAAYTDAKHQVYGPARGLWQMEPATHDDLLNWIEPQFMTSTANNLAGRFYEAIGFGPYSADRMVYDLRYACAMCRLHYWRVPDPLPAVNDRDGMAAYWKRHYNTRSGAGREEDLVLWWGRYQEDLIA